MAGEDLIVPAPPLGPDDLGLSMPPQAPQAPIQSAPQDDFKSKLMKLLAIGVAGGMGPGMGTGVLQGMAHADQQKEQTRLRNDQIARQTYQQQQGDYEQQQRIYAQEAQRRQQAIMQSRDSLMKIAPTLKTKAEYDKYVEAYASGLQSMGLRISPNWFRQAVPYNAPDVGERAAKTLDGYMKNQVNADNLKNHPESLKTATVWFDRMGEGTKQKILLTDLAILADQPFGEGPDGIIVYPKGTTAETKASAEGILQDLLDKDLAEGTVQTPQRRIELKQQAIKLAKEAATPEKPPTEPRQRFNVQPITNKDGTTGLVRINMDTGDTTAVDLPEGAGSGRASDTQRLSSAYLTRTTAANTTAQAFEQNLLSLGSQFDVKMPNLLKSAAGQQYKQAKDEFINAALRRESGAAIQPSEYDRFDQIYFVMPGDRATVIKQKQAARQRVIDGFKTAAGNLSTPGGTGPTVEEWERGPDGKLRKKGA